MVVVVGYTFFYLHTESSFTRKKHTLMLFTHKLTNVVTNFPGQANTKDIIGPVSSESVKYSYRQNQLVFKLLPISVSILAALWRSLILLQPVRQFSKQRTLTDTDEIGSAFTAVNTDKPDDTLTSLTILCYWYTNSYIGCRLPIITNNTPIQSANIEETRTVNLRVCNAWNSSRKPAIPAKKFYHTTKMVFKSITTQLQANAASWPLMKNYMFHRVIYFSDTNCWNEITRRLKPCIQYFEEKNCWSR